MFQLTGKVGLDASGFYRALTGMKSAAAPLGNQIARQLGSRFMAFFGAGSFVNTFRKTLAGAFEIRKESGKLGLDTSTFQTLSMLAEQTGASMTEMVEKLEEGGFAQAIADANKELLETGRIIEEQTVQKLAGLMDKFMAIGSRVAPGLAWMADTAISGYDWLKGKVEKSVFAVQHIIGDIIGDNDMKQAGMDLFSELEPSGPAAETALDKARVLATEIAKATAVENKKTVKDPTVKEERRQDGLKTGDETWGRYFGKGPGLTPVENQLRLLNRTVYDMNQKLGNVL